MQTKNILESPTQAFNVLNTPGNLLIYPTNTVWGIGCIITNNTAVKNLFLVKKRQPTKPVSILVSNVDMAKKYAHIDNTIEAELQKHWPGKTTFVLRAKNLSPLVHGGTNFVGLRCIDHPFISELLDLCKVPLITTSANLSGENPVENGKELLGKMPDYVYCVDDDVILTGPPSEVIKIDGEIKTKLR